MKVLKFALAICFLAFYTTASAQYGYGNNGMYGGDRMRSAQTMQSNYGKTIRPEEIEKEKTENLNKAIENLAKDLNLDDLQVIVIRKEVEASSKNIDKIIKGQASNEDKAKEIEAISEKADRNINTFLNEEQKTKYKKYIEERKVRMEMFKK